MRRGDERRGEEGIGEERRREEWRGDERRKEEKGGERGEELREGATLPHPPPPAAPDMSCGHAHRPSLSVSLPLSPPVFVLSLSLAPFTVSGSPLHLRTAHPAARRSAPRSESPQPSTCGLGKQFLGGVRQGTETGRASELDRRTDGWRTGVGVRQMWIGRWFGKEGEDGYIVIPRPGNEKNFVDIGGIPGES